MQEEVQVLLVGRKPVVAVYAGVDDGKVFRVGLAQEKLGRHMVPVGVHVPDPCAARDTPRLLAFVHEFVDLVHRSLQVLIGYWRTSLAPRGTSVR